MAAVGFISEHTAEYVLVPQLVSLLAPYFKRIVPFYFWASREGNKTSRESGPHEEIRVISVYARRPKISRPYDHRVTVKVNSDLFTAAHISPSFGIPVFAGVPVVTSISQLTMDAPCLWFHLAPESGFNADAEFSILDDDANNCEKLPDQVTGPLDSAEIVRIIEDVTQLMTWDQATENLREIRSSAQETLFHTRFLGGYRPFHLLLMNN